MNGLAKGLCLIVIGLLLTGAGNIPPYKIVHAATLRITLDDSMICGGTAVGLHAVMTAEHCILKGESVIDGKHMRMSGKAQAYMLDGDKVTVKRILRDGHDHVLLTVDKTFYLFALFGPAPEQGDEVFLYGNPGGLADVARFGRMVGRYDGCDLYDVNAWHGDSGSAIFNANGRIVGMASNIPGQLIEGEGAWHLLAGYPVIFTPKEIAEASQ